jgi:hypothetical protein
MGGLATLLFREEEVLLVNFPPDLGADMIAETRHWSVRSNSEVLPDTTAGILVVSRLGILVVMVEETLNMAFADLVANEGRDLTHNSAAGLFEESAGGLVPDFEAAVRPIEELVEQLVEVLVLCWLAVEPSGELAVPFAELAVPFEGTLAAFGMLAGRLADNPAVEALVASVEHLVGILVADP